jgi:hypothetical protein
MFGLRVTAVVTHRRAAVTGPSVSASRVYAAISSHPAPARRNAAVTAGTIPSRRMPRFKVAIAAG